MIKATQLRIWHKESGILLAEGPKGWGITPFEGNYYIRKKYLSSDLFHSTPIPGLCPYKGIYHWLNLNLPDGQQVSKLGWRYIVPNPLFPFVAFRVGLPGHHFALEYETTRVDIPAHPSN